MASDISINLVADSSGVVKASRESSDALGKVSDSLDELTKQSGRAVDDDMFDGVVKGGKQAESELQRVERSFKEVAEASERSTSGSSGIGGYGKKVQHEAKEAGEGISALRENTAQNLKETAASFNGSVDSIGGGAQGLIAELLEGFGPVGLIAGAVAAGGLGLLITGMDNAQQSTQQETQDVQNLASQLIDAGTKGKAALSDVSSSLKDIATGASDTAPSLEAIEAQAKSLKVPFRELVGVYTQGGDATQFAIDRTKRLIEAEKQRLNQNQEAVGQNTTILSDQDNLTRSLGKQLSSLQETQKQWRKARQDQAEYVKAGGPALERAAAAASSYASDIQSTLSDAGDSWEKYTHKGKVDLNDYNDALDDSRKAIEHYQRNVKVASASLSQDALNYIESLGPKAAPLLQAYVDAPLKDKQRTAHNWAVLGKQAGNSYTGALAAGIPKSIKGPDVIIGKPDTGAVIQTLAGLGRQTYNIPVYLQVKNGKRLLP